MLLSDCDKIKFLQVLFVLFCFVCVCVCVCVCVWVCVCVCARVCGADLFAKLQLRRNVFYAIYYDNIIKKQYSLYIHVFTLLKATFIIQFGQK